MAKLTGYDLTRQWFEMVWEHPELTANHTALYMGLSEIWNRIGQPKEFQITSTECMKTMSAKSYNTFKKTFDDLIEMGCIKLIKQSRNQYQCNVIGLLKFDKAPDKALNKAQLKARAKALETFIKPLTLQPTTLNPQQEKVSADADSLEPDLPKEQKEEKKETVPPKEKKERTDLHHRVIAAYSDFMQAMNGVKPQINGADGIGAKRIIEYLTKIVKGEKTDDEVCGAFEYILSHWSSVDKFTQKQVKLFQIAGNINTIITQIKNPKLNSNGKQQATDDLGKVIADHYTKNPSK